MFVSIIWIIVGFLLLIKGADFLVDGASSIAKKFHVSEIVIGLTVVSIGTSMPELFVSITSALDGFSDMAMGNALGSNLANLLLVLGVSSIIRPVEIKKETKLIEIPICFLVTVLFAAVCNIGGNVTRADSLVLLILFVLFIIYTIVMTFESKKLNNEMEENLPDSKDKSSTLKDLFFIILGIVALKFGGDFTVNNAVKIAQVFNWSEKLISITILAIGTTLPELVTSVSAAIKGKSDIAVGNIIGSNIFNLLLIIGVSAMIEPIVYNYSYNMDMAILIVGTFLLGIFPFIEPKNVMSRKNGILYVFMYFSYLAIAFMR